MGHFSGSQAATAYFNYDFGVSFTPEQQDKPVFNYGTAVPGMPDREAASAFFRDADARQREFQ